MEVRPYFLKIRNQVFDIKDNSEVGICKLLTYKGTDYKPGLFLVENSLKNILEIVEVLYLHHNNTVLLACTKQEMRFDVHFNAYNVIFSKKTDTDTILVNITEFKYFPLCLHIEQRKKHCRPKCI